MGFVIRAFYISRSYSLTGKSHIGSILPILSAVVFLVILVVKSSLALSLGLVGALSIVRFRTPIKEPEELVYLFLAIALGLGYGAGQVLLTTICIVIILIVIYLWLSNRSIRKTYEYNMVINWNDENLEFNSILQEIEPRLLSLKLIRLDYGDSNNTAVLLIEPNENEDKRNYKVSAEKLMQVGFHPSRTIDDAIKEIGEAIENKEITNYADEKYSNYKLLFGSKEMQEKVFMLGIPGSLDVP